MLLETLPVLDVLHVLQTCRRLRRLLETDVYGWIFREVLAAVPVAGTPAFTVFDRRVDAAAAIAEGRHIVSVVRGAAHAGKSLANFKVPAEMRAILSREAVPLMWPKGRMISRSLAKKHFKVPSDSPAWNTVSPSRSYYNYAGHFGSSFRAYYSLQNVFQASFVANGSLAPVAALYAKRSLVAARKANRVAANAATFRALLADHGTTMEAVEYAIPLLPSFQRYMQGIASVQQAMLKKTIKALLALHKALDPAALDALRTDPVSRSECEPLFQALMVDYSAAVEDGARAATVAVAAVAKAVKATLWRYFGPQCEECMRAAASPPAADAEAGVKAEVEEHGEAGCKVGRGYSKADARRNGGADGSGGRRFFDDADLQGHIDVEHRRPQRAAKNLVALAEEVDKRKLGRSGLVEVVGLKDAFLEFVEGAPTAPPLSSVAASLDRLAELRILLGDAAEKQVLALFRDLASRNTVVSTLRTCMLPGPSQTSPIEAVRDLLRSCRGMTRGGGDVDHASGPFVDNFHCFVCGTLYSSVAHARRHVLFDHSEEAARALLPPPKFFCAQCPPGGSHCAGGGADSDAAGAPPVAFESVRDLNLHYLAVHRPFGEAVAPGGDSLDDLLVRREAELDAALASCSSGGDPAAAIGAPAIGGAPHPIELLAQCPARLCLPPPPLRERPAERAWCALCPGEGFYGVEEFFRHHARAHAGTAPVRGACLLAPVPTPTALRTSLAATVAAAAAGAAAGAAGGSADELLPLLPSPRDSPAYGYIDPFMDEDSMDDSPYDSQPFLFDSPMSSWAGDSPASGRSQSGGDLPDFW